MAHSTETLIGVADKTLYRDENSGFTVCLLLDEQGRSRKLTGKMRAPFDGEELEVTGHWGSSKYGKEFQVQSVEYRIPQSEDGLYKFLCSDFIPGIGPKYARQLVDKFGTKLPHIIKTFPSSLKGAGIGAKRVTALRQGMELYEETQPTLTYLLSIGLTPGKAMQIMLDLGADAARKIQENPYLLTKMVGFGFLSADKAALQSGIPADAPLRVEAAIHYALDSLSQKGHVSCTEEQVVRATSDLLGNHKDQQKVASAVIRDAMDSLVKNHKLVRETFPDGSAFYFKPKLYHYELMLAQRLHEIMNRVTPWQIDRLDEVIVKEEQAQGITLSDSQREAVRTALINNLVVVTGGPGTGKTTIMRVILSILQQHGISIEIAAPSGRAAKRLEESVGLPGQTLHRLLEFAPGRRCGRDRHNPIDAQMITVDEVSLADLGLCYRLMEAVGDNTACCIVGDVDQLPSIGPGNVLSDLIESGVIPTVRLTEIFRQAKSSAIITNAHRINRGQMIETAPQQGDFDFIGVNTDEDAAQVIEEIVTGNYGGFSYAANDIQVLSAMRRGAAGVEQLNERLQSALNPQAHDKISTGDRVVITRNAYDLLVFNGDTGVIQKVLDDGYTVALDDGRIIDMKGKASRSLLLAYAITVHRSQGSQYPVVIMPVLSSQYILLERNLVYTGITRASQHCIVVGQHAALEKASQIKRAGQRKTRLKDRIIQLCG